MKTVITPLIFDTINSDGTIYSKKGFTSSEFISVYVKANNPHVSVDFYDKVGDARVLIHDNKVEVEIVITSLDRISKDCNFKIIGNGRIEGGVAHTYSMTGILAE